MRQRVILLLSALAAGSPTSAQVLSPEAPAPQTQQIVDSTTGVTLDQAIWRALEREPSLRAARADIDQAQGRQVQSALRPNPIVSFMQQADPAGTDAQTTIQVQWPLDLFRKTGRVAVAERDLEATQQATADRERLLVTAVRMAFGEALTAVRDLSVTDELVEATAQQQALLAARADQGAIAPLERDMVTVELQRLRAERILQAGRAERALIDLKRLMGLSPDAPLRLAEDLEQLVQREAAGATAGKPPASTRSDVREAQARVALADARVDQARRDGRLDLSVVGMYTRTDAGFSQRGFGAGGGLERVRGVFHYLAGGVMASVPLRDRNQGSIAAARAQQAGARAQLDAVQLTVQMEVAAARVRDEQARRALAVYTSETRALAKQNLDVVGQSYELGSMTLVDVLNERRRYLETERAYTSVLREVYGAQTALRGALGEVR